MPQQTNREPSSSFIMQVGKYLPSANQFLYWGAAAFLLLAADGVAQELGVSSRAGRLGVSALVLQGFFSATDKVQQTLDEIDAYRKDFVGIR